MKECWGNKQEIKEREENQEGKKGGRESGRPAATTARGRGGGRTPSFLKPIPHPSNESLVSLSFSESSSDRIKTLSI